MNRWLRRPRYLPSRQAYRQWAAFYPPRAHNALMRLEETAMLALLSDVDGQHILDLGSGTGRYGHILLARRARVVVGVDNSPEMLAYNALTWRVLATTEALPFRASSFDGIVCALALGHLPSLDKSFEEMARLLKAGGWALVSDFHPFQALAGAKRTFEAAGRQYVVEHYAHLYADYQRAATAAGLRIITILEPTLPEKGALPIVLALSLRRD